MRAPLSILLVFALAGPAIAQRPAAPPWAQAERYSQRLQQLDELRRYATLRRVIANSGFACRRLEYAAPRTRYRNLVQWAARCTNGDYALYIGPDETVQVRPCAQAARLKLPACRLPPRPRARS